MIRTLANRAEHANRFIIPAENARVSHEKVLFHIEGESPDHLLKFLFFDIGYDSYHGGFRVEF